MNTYIKQHKTNRDGLELTGSIKIPLFQSNYSLSFHELPGNLLPLLKRKIWLTQVIAWNRPNVKFQK